MHKNQFTELCKELNIIGRYGVVPDCNTCLLYILTGKQKGKNGKIIEIKDTSLIIQIEEKKPLTFHYTKVERVDKNGNPIFQNAKDITGRSINDGAVVCYSVSAGENSHALEIGKVIKTNPSGLLTVRPIVRNGMKIENNYFYKKRGNIRSERTILLPIDNTLVTMWIISDFEVYKDGALLD
jgi:hypothetical protein